VPRSAAVASVKMAPGEFTRQVAADLRHLYEPSGLARSVLPELLLPPDASPERRTRQLRALLLETLESLNPGPKVPFRSLAARSYQALHLHYVEGHTIEDVGRLLAISLRQAYRDVRKGEADLATLLWQRRQNSSPARAAQAQSSGNALRQEVRRLPLRPVDLSLQQALSQAAEPLAPLANGACVRLSLRLAEDRQVRADPDNLRQCLTALLSCAVQACGTGPAEVSATLLPEADRPGGASLRLTSRPLRPGGLAALANLLAVVRTLAEAVGDVEIHSSPDEQQAYLQLRLPPSFPATLMVVDDNEGLPELFRRYLSESGYAVLGVTDASEGLRLARERPPRMIVLDILMPGMDGWALLAQLKANPVTAHVPVIVCSVFDDPELARSLGAAACVTKPVSQATLLRVLREVGHDDTESVDRDQLSPG